MKSKILLTIVAICMQVLTLSAQNAFWAKGYATGTADFTATDAQGNIYTSGVFHESLEIDGEEIIAANPYNSWLAKFNPAGELQWMVNITSSDYAVVLDMIISADGKPVITGYSHGMVNFGPLLMGNESDNFSRGFIAVYEPDGECTMVTGTNGECAVAFTEVAIDSEGNFAVAGQADAEFSHGLSLVENYGGLDAIYGLYDQELNPVWMKSIGGPGADAAAAISFDNNDEIILAGFYEGDFLYFDLPFSSQGGTDLFLIKSDRDGYFHWMRTMGGPYEDFQYWMDIETDVNGYVYFCSNMVEEMFHQGGYNAAYGGTDPFVVRYNSAGGFDWFVHGGGSDYDLAFGMTKGNNDNLYLFGYFLGAAEFQGLQLYADVESDGFYAEVGLNGTVNLVAQTDGNDVEWYSSMAVDPWNNLIASGYFTNNISFEGEGTIGGIGEEYTTFLVKYETAYSQPEVSVADHFNQTTHLSIYPNPAVSTATIELSGNESIETILIANAEGRQIATIAVNGSSTTSLDVSDYAGGIYFLSAVSASGKMIETQIFTITK